MAGTASTIGKAYVQILPSMEGIAGQMTSMLGGPAQQAGQAAGAEMGDAMGGSLSSGLLSALTGIGSKIADVMKTAISEVTGFIADSVNVGKDFDSSMSQIAATMGMTSEQIKNNLEFNKEGDKAGETFDLLRSKAKEMGAATNFSASQAADGLNILAMSGYDAEKSVSMIEDVLHLAAAGGMDMATAAKDISGAMKGFQDSTKDSAYYADLMAKGATLANTNVTQLGEALSGAAAQGAAYKQNAESMTVALLRLAEQGETGSNASTMLAAAMKNLYTPTEQAMEAMNELGVAAYDSKGNYRDINTVVNELNKSLGKYSDEQQAAYINTIFGIQGQEAYNKMVVTSIDKQNEWADVLAGASGEAEKQYSTMTDNLAGDIDIWNSALEGFKIEISDQVMPAVRDFVKFGSDGLGRLTEAFKSGGIEGMADEFGKLLEELTEKVSDIFPTILNAFTKIAGGAVTAFTKALPSIVTAIKQAIPQIAAALGSIADALIEVFPDLTDAFVQLVGEIAKELPQVLPKIGQALMTAIPALINGLTELLPILLETLTDIIEQIAQMIPEIIPPLFTAIVNTIPILVQTIADNLPIIIQALTDVVMAIADVIPTILPVLTPALTDAVCAIIEGLAKAAVVLPELASAVLDVTMAVADALIDNLPVLIDGIVQIMEAIGQATIDNFPEIMDALGKLLVKIVDEVEGWFPKIWGALKGVWTKIIDGIKNNWGSFMSEVYEWGDSIIEAADDIAEDMAEFWGGLWDKMVEAGANLIKGIGEGIKEGWKNLTGEIEEFGDTVVETFCDIFDINSPSKVMEDMIGRNLALGIGKGFDKEIDGVSSSMSSSVGAVLDDMTGLGLSANVSRSVTYQTAGAQAADTAAAQKQPFKLTVEIPDRRTVAEWVFPDINELMGQETVLSTHGYAAR